MKRYVSTGLLLIAIIVVFILFAKVAHCQTTFTTNVTATITDSDNQTWNNGTWSATLYNPSATQQPVYTQTGQPVPVFIQNQNLTSLGALSYAFPDNNQITPLGTRWVVTLCSNTSAPCSLPSSNLLVTGTSIDLSTQLSSQLTVPRFVHQSSAHGYLDIEVSNPVLGTMYYNVTAGAQRTCTVVSGTSCTTWVQSGPGSGNVNTGQQYQPAYYPSSGATIQGDTVALADGSGNWNFKSVNTLRMASMYQTSSGSNNGILNAVTANGTVIADPSYCVDAPYTWQNQPHAPGPNNASFISYCNGVTTGYSHNPSGSLFVNSNYHVPWQKVLDMDTISNSPTGIGSVTRVTTGEREDFWFHSPGFSLGNNFGSNGGWTQTTGHVGTMTVNTPGISEYRDETLIKAGIGDAANHYLREYAYGGRIAASDEGPHLFAVGGGEASTTFAGNITTGTTGATTVKVTCFQDCANPGDGRFLIKMAVVDSGAILNRTNPSGVNPGTITIDHNITPSTAWGYLNGNCFPPVGTPVAGVSGAQFTCGVIMQSGTFNVGDLVCFGGGFHEQLILNAPTNATQISGLFRHQHPSASPVMANGPCGTFIDHPANDANTSTTTFTLSSVAATTGTTTTYTGTGLSASTCAIGGYTTFTITGFTNSLNNGTWTCTASTTTTLTLNNTQGIAETHSGTAQGGVLLRYPIDIIGATNATTLAYAAFATGGAQIFPGGKSYPYNFGATNMNNTNGIVTFGLSGGVNRSTHPELFANATLVITGSTSFNGLCTNSYFTAGNGGGSSQNGISCTQSSSIGATPANQTGTINLYGLTNYVTYAGAEVLDVNDYTTTPANVCNNGTSFNSCTLTLEANNVTWTNGDLVEQPHHYQYSAIAFPLSHTQYAITNNTASNTLSIGVGGTQWYGSPGNSTSPVPLAINNGQSAGTYGGHGGVGSPTQAIYETGLWSSLLTSFNAPEPSGIGTALWVGCPSVPSSCTDPNFSYFLYTLSGGSGGQTAAINDRIYPAFGVHQLGGLLEIPNALPALTMQDGLTFAQIATPPAITSMTALPYGGNLPDNTTYTYTYVVHNSYGDTPQSATSANITTGTSGGHNSIQGFVARVQGAGYYKLCGGSAGTGTTLAYLNSGGTTASVDLTSFLDTGQTPVGGACSTTNTTQPGISGVSKITYSGSSGFTTVVQPNASQAAAATFTLPAATGTIPSVSTTTPVVGKATCWKTTTQIGYCSTQPDSTGSCTCN